MIDRIKRRSRAVWLGTQAFNKNVWYDPETGFMWKSVHRFSIIGVKECDESLPYMLEKLRVNPLYDCHVDDDLTPIE